jgi:hypothetical protein
MSGSLGSTPTVKIYGDTQHNGYIRFDPVTTNIDQSISASYIYVSGSTNDLYFSQNSAGYSNTTRLRWLEGNLYTGLLHGGIITAATGSTTYQISSGSGIIVNLNASLSDDPYPTIQYLNWGNLSASIAPLTASYQQAFVSIDSTGNIYQQGTPYVAGQFDTEINIGVVLFQNGSTINGVKTQPSTAYGFEQNQNIFNRAFGPLKLSGYTLAPSGSSTGSLIVASGTAYSPGSNYPIDPNNPSYTTDSGTNVSKIFRYRQSGSTWVYDTNAGLGYGAIDPTQYSDNGVLTAVPGGGSNREFSIQRVFYFPNSVAKAIVVYYGNATYASLTDATANIPFEPFVEAPNTAANAIYLGAIIVRNNADFTVTDSYAIQLGGLFRSVGGSGGGGSVITQTLAGLSDVNISGPNNLQPLAYSNTQAKWINTSTLSASIAGNATTATSASHALNSDFAISSSYALNATSASGVAGGTPNYLPIWKTNTALSRSAFYQDPDNLNYVGLFTNVPSYSLDVLGTIRAQDDLYGLTKVYFPNLSTGAANYNVVIIEPIAGQLYQITASALTVATASYVLNAVSASYAATASSADNFVIRQNATASNLLVNGTITAQTLVVQTVTSSVVYSSGSNIFGNSLSNTQQLTGSVSITGSLAASLTPNTLTNVVSYNTTTGQLFYQSTSSLSVTTASYALTASAATTFNISSSLYSAAGATVPGSTETTFLTLTTGSYRAGFFDYTVSSGSNARAGTLMSVWNDGSVQYTDTSTLSIGDTSGIVIRVEIGGSNAQLVAAVTTAGSWNVRTTYRLI